MTQETGTAPPPAQSDSGVSPRPEVVDAMSASTTGRRRGRRGSTVENRDGRSAWFFVAPMIIIFGLFLVIPIFMALWVSVSDWSGRGSPFSPEVNFVGGENYGNFFEAGLAQRDLTPASGTPCTSSSSSCRCRRCSPSGSPSSSTRGA